jgi:hypothetical protein
MEISGFPGDKWGCTCKAEFGLGLMVDLSPGSRWVTPPSHMPPARGPKNKIGPLKTEETDFQ